MNPEAKKQVNKLFLFIFLSFLLTSHVAAQSVLSFERIEGLSQSTGYAITKDKQGFLWIATADGLNRYDGVEMRAYKPGRGKTDGYMMGRLIRSDILEDDHERIWFSTDLAVHSFDKKTELFKTWPLSKQNQFANPLLFRDGHLWLANADAGLFDLDISTGESTFYPSTTRLMYNGVSDNNNNLWFASNKGLLQFNLTTKQWQQYFSDKEFYSVAISNDTLFISEKKNILVAPLNTPHNYSFAEFSNQERDLVHRIYADEMKNIWVGDESGNVFFRQHGTKRFQWSGNINRAGRVRTNYPVYCFYYDPSGRLWTGGYMFGLIKAEIRKQGFTVFPQSGSGAAPENIFVNTFFEQGNEVWLGTFQKGIVILDKTTGLTRTFDLPYSGPPLVYGKSVHLIRSDNHGNLWTGSSGYLYVRKKGSGSFTPILIPLVPSALQNPQVWSIAENENGWLIGTNVGVYQVAESANKFAIGHIEALGNSRVAGLCRAPSGEWYIAFESGGIVVTKDPTSSEGQTRIFEDTNVRALYYDDRHSMLWICSSDGLIAWHSASRQHKIVAPDNYTYAVLPDSNDLWVSTNSGLIKASLRYSGNDPLPGATLVTFTTRDGLPDNQFNANAAHKGMSGTFYFGTPSGIVWFSPRDVQPNAAVPGIVMTDVAVNGERTPSAGYLTSMSLPWSQNNLFFRFRGIEYSNPAKVNYSYQLKGWNKEWIDNGTSNEVRYNNLPPGDYTFQVRTANSSGAWSDDLYSVAITITPPFWKTGWFYTAAVIVFVGAVVMITRRISFMSFQRKLAELERQREIDRERQRISREMHDDIGAGLTRITLISEFARNKGTVGVSTELEEIAGTSRQLVSNMGEIIWSLNPENGTLDQLLAYLREQLHRQLEYSAIDYTISFPDDKSGLMLSNEARRNIILATREIVNNSIKHSKAKSISIAANVLGSTIKFEVADNGTGFDTTRIYPGNGLNNIRQRIAALGGDLTVTSTPGSGSRFSFLVKL